MRAITTREAKTHLSRLLDEVQAGAEIVILRGNVPVARLTSLGAEPSPRRRPKVGTITSAPILHDADAFVPLGDEVAVEEA